MAKKKPNPGKGDHAKSSAISTYLKANNGAKPKEVVAALSKQGLKVSPSMVSIIRAKAGVKKARRQATKAVAVHEKGAARKTHQASSLEAALTLYKAARGMDVPGAKIRESFLMLVETLG